MNQINMVNFVLAVLTFSSVFAIGVAIAEQNALGIILSIIGAFVFFSIGFTLKRKWNHRNTGPQ